MSGGNFSDLANNLKHTTVAAKAGQAALSGLSMAGNMLVVMLASMAISKGIEWLDKWINKEKYAKEALDNSISSYEAVTEEVNSLQEELATCTSRLQELQNAASNGTISLTEEKELETLKKQNDELERKLALKQSEQIDKQKEVLENSNELINDKITSHFLKNENVNAVNTTNSSEIARNTTTNSFAQNVTKDEELIAGVNEYQRLLSLQEENSDADYSYSIKRAADRIKEMYADISPSIEAYENLIESGYELSNDEQIQYDSLKKAESSYMLYNYKAYGTEAAYNALDTEQQREVLFERLKSKNLSDDNANAVLNSLSESEIDKLWDENISFAPPEITDDAKNFGREYAKAWLDGVRESTNPTTTSDGRKITFNDQWNDLDSSSDENLKNFKSEVTDLANSGRLTVQAFNNTNGSSTFLEQIGLSAEEAVEKINSLTESTKPLESLQSSIGSIQDAYSEKLENGVVSSSTLSSMSETFGDLGEEWENYKNIVGSSSSTVKECEKAQNDLATAYINSNNFLSGLVDETGNCTDANKQYYISQLENLGIKNAEEVVNNAIIQQKAQMKLDSFDLATASAVEITALANENNKLGESSEAYKNYIFYKALASENALDTSESINNLIALAEQCGITGQTMYSLITLQGLKDTYNDILASGNSDTQHALPGLQAQIDAETQKLNNLANSKTENTEVSTDTSKIDANSNKSGTAGGNLEKSSKQTFDWIERRINHAADLTKRTVDSITNYITQKAKNTRYSTLLKNIDKEINANNKAAKKYQAKANKIAKNNNISKDTIKKIKNGDFSISDIDSEKAEAINDYISYYEKAQNAKQTAREKRQEKREKTREATDSKIEFRTNRLDSRRAKADSIQSDIDIAESRGLSGTTKQYNSLIRNAKKQKKNLTKQNKILTNYLVDNNIKKNSAEWFAINKQIEENNTSIKDLTKNQVEWNKSIEDLKLNRFEYLNNVLGSIKSKFEAIHSLQEAQGKEMSDKDIAKSIEINKRQMDQNDDNRKTISDSIKDKATASKNSASGWGWGLTDKEFAQFESLTQLYRDGDITEDYYKNKLKPILDRHGLNYTDDIVNNTDLNDDLSNISELAIDNINLMTENEQLLDTYREKAVKAAQDYVDKLKEANEAKSKAIELERIQQKLQTAKQNKTTLVYREGYGFNYEADTDAIDEAQMELDEYQFNALMDSMDDFIEALENADLNMYDENGKLIDNFQTLSQTYLNTFKQIAAEYGITNASFIENDKGGYELSSTVTDAYATNTAYALSSLSSDNMSILREMQQRIDESMKSITSITQSTENTSKTISIGNLSFPNINDSSTVTEFINALTALDSYALQSSNKNK